MDFRANNKSWRRPGCLHRRRLAPSTAEKESEPQRSESKAPARSKTSLMGVPRKVTRLSALGHKRTFAVQNDMSALPPKADICSARAHVRFVPIADIAASTTCPGFRDFTPLNRQTAGQRHHDGKPASDAKLRQNTHC